MTALFNLYIRRRSISVIVHAVFSAMQSQVIIYTDQRLIYSPAIAYDAVKGDQVQLYC